jgi:CRP-like cAMP-binding protein
VQIINLGPGQMFGEEDVINCRLYTTTVKCLTNTVIFEIKADEFISKFGREEKAWQFILSRVKAKDKETIDIIKRKIILQN